jgi:hypothetical protein
MRRVHATLAYSGIRVLLAAMLWLLAVVALPSSARSTDEVVPHEVVPPKSDIQRAQAALEVQVQKHPVLEGVTVEISDALDYQAVAYYTEGRIVISSDHTATIERIIEHEVWHVIDWRDNGQIDWGESVPPVDATT